MAFKRLLCLGWIFCFIFAQAGHGQEQGLAPMPSQPGSDPFRLDVGSSFSASGSAAMSGKKGTSLRTEAVSADLEEAMAVIRRNHISSNRFDPGSLTSAAITSMLKTLDPHSNYFTPSEFQAMLDEHASEYTGIGTSISAFERNGTLDTYVLATVPGSPAARIGLKFGDRIFSIDGKNTIGMSVDEVRDLLRGRNGSILNMTIARGPEETRMPFVIRRERLHDTAVPRGFVLRGGAGYIDLTNGFNNSTFKEFEQALADVKRQGAVSLVLDLRGNGGGILDQAVKVAEKFLPRGSIIVSQKGRTPSDSRTWRAGKSGHETMPLVLLVDEQSASATEVVAGALQDNDRALIVGRRTFGKGLVQNVLNLPEGAGLTLTAARYFTPTGRSIQREYADSGLYNYYNHRVSAEIDKPVFAARTPTERVVYGGDGIDPDILLTAHRFTHTRVTLLAPIFHFSLRILNPGAFSRPPSPRADRAGEPRIGENTLKEFGRFLGENETWRLLMEEAADDKEFVLSMLDYYVAMGTSGMAAANRARVESDPEVIAAVNTIPRAASLNSAAERARQTSRAQKGPSSRVLDGQR